MEVVDTSVLGRVKGERMPCRKIPEGFFFFENGKWGMPTLSPMTSLKFTQTKAVSAYTLHVGPHSCPWMGCLFPRCHYRPGIHGWYRPQECGRESEGIALRLSPFRHVSPLHTFTLSHTGGSMPLPCGNAES